VLYSSSNAAPSRFKIRRHPMRRKLVMLALLILTQAGCAGGFRIGGNRFGAGIGGYIGPVPDVIRSEQSYYVPPPSVEVAAPR
jgi:hypothetical protein